MPDFVRVGAEPHTWGSLVSQWRAETESLGEHWDEEEQLQSDILRPLTERNDPKAGVYATVDDNGQYRSICQLNTVGLPGYDKPVMRMRHLTFAPSIDLSGQAVDPYIEALVETFWRVVRLCRTPGRMNAGFMNFHLPSPNDRTFFMVVGDSFVSNNLFGSIASKGSWLYITMDTGGQE
mgnify:CR=1 FL=1